MAGSNGPVREACVLNEPPCGNAAIDVVAAQLAAYNARDVERFMACWRDDARLYLFPDTLLAAGSDAIRKRHATRFAEPWLHAELLGRHAAGRVVVDHERVTKTANGEPVKVMVLAIYEVAASGLIISARFAEGPDHGA